MIAPEIQAFTRVSMESGLDGRNNGLGTGRLARGEHPVSMESGLDGRNNGLGTGRLARGEHPVSMESGLDGRNNRSIPRSAASRP